jgi:hypothetical protein
MKTNAVRTRVHILAIALVALCAARIAAQEHTEISGVVRTIQGNRLEVQSGERRWIVIVDSELVRESKQRTEIEFHARGRGSIVERGMWVRFFADVDAAGKVIGNVRKLTWFTPTKLNREGAFPAEPRDGDEPLVRWERPQQGEIIAGHYLIVGSVRAVERGLMRVIYLDGEKERQLLAQLAPDVEIEIDITHKETAGKMIMPGDVVEVRGRPRENQVHALSIVVRREAVLGKELVALTERPTRRPVRGDNQSNDPQPNAEGDEEPVANADRPMPKPLVSDEAAAPPATSGDKPTRSKILRVN